MISPSFPSFPSFFLLFLPTFRFGDDFAVFSFPGSLSYDWLVSTVYKLIRRISEIFLFLEILDAAFWGLWRRLKQRTWTVFARFQNVIRLRMARLDGPAALQHRLPNGTRPLMAL